MQLQRTLFSAAIAMMVLSACAQVPDKTIKIVEETYEVNKTSEEWKAQLSENEYHILRQKGTEQPFTGKYWDEHADGTYTCAACSAPLFDAGTKFKSGTGWPSFYEPLEGGRVLEITDNSHGMARTEVVCNRCGGHLGHIFNDGPQPTGLRYCINSASLNLENK